MKNALHETTMNLSPDTEDNPKTTTDTGGTDGPKTGGGGTGQGGDGKI